jgi:hypothetical protein
MRQEVLVRGLMMAGLFALQSAHAQTTIPVPQLLDPANRVAQVEKDLEAIRGLTFRHSVPVAKQTPEDLARYLDQELAKEMPEALSENFDRLVKRLGLYRGPELGNLRDTMRMVMTSQVAAYYDAETERIWVLNGGGNEQEEGLVYAHELYHAMQDQYFDLQAYMPQGSELDADQVLARTAVVEGEATYIHTMWVLRNATRSLPPRALLSPLIQMQANLSLEQLRGMIGEGGGGAAAGMDDVPAFILETLMGNYMKGAAFVFAVQEKGWPEVEKLYREYPPRSTEQILHPEKWFARESATSITWPDFGKERVLRDWELIDEDVLGEIQWRIIFKAQGQADGEAAAAGWDGDRYAVFGRKGSDDTLMLLRTAWDTEQEATQFVAAYRRALAVKYEGRDEPVSIEQQGTDVFIVEGGRKTDLDALLKLVKQSKKQRG